MVLNLCMQHFQTSVQCNKLCVDGYDVSNLLSGDPIVRRRGFKLEYFLRPPFHVTLSFRVKMELSRVDVELWPWGMDQGKTSRRLEILTCSDIPVQLERDTGQFKLVAHCDLQKEAQVCFLHPTFRPRAPFADPPPQPSPQAKLLEFWNRGPQSLGSVAHLRVSIPYSGAGSSLGIKSLAVWGLPARCCPPSELEMIREAHLNNLKTNTPLDVPSKPDFVPADTPVPEEFLDPLTQELLVFPMILPSGMVIDNSTLEEYQKREATWGRLPNDPFTGVPFTQTSKPLPNPLLKSRIDRLALQTGCTGLGARNNPLPKPQPSRLTMPSNTMEPMRSTDSGRSQNHIDSLPGQFKGPQNQEAPSQPVACVLGLGSISGRRTGPSVNQTRKTQSHYAKRKYESSFPSTSVDLDCSSGKVPLTDDTPSRATESVFSVGAHERRLADSLDQALNAALHGLPMFTSQSKNDSIVDTSTGQYKCVFCTCALTAYSSSAVSYSLPCAHLLCGSCLHHKYPPDSRRVKIKCPSCGTSASASDITRVHH
ncbi:RING finger protein 37 [Xyrauchen texanus]|uniref:RING finger protein 37 n=1 Tax=Xyrauchen texanus TaxID=154827 RepID=UPI002241DEA1|nr:RING finger protein 37 [Xyrauchen texanus]